MPRNKPGWRTLYKFLSEIYSDLIVETFEEVLGKGIVASINNKKIQLGSAKFLNVDLNILNETAIHIQIDTKYFGYFVFNNSYREGMKRIFSNLCKDYKLVILSGDNEGEKPFLEKVLPPNTQLVFNQNPENKLEFIKALQENGAQVLMIGDGLNDAGALAQSNVGIAISEDVNVFSPACDAILDAKLFNKLPDFLTLSKKTIKIIKSSFVLSFLYNLVGLYFALTGQLTPIVAAILMPLSSISIVIYVTILTNLASRKL